MNTRPHAGVEKLPTHVGGLDYIFEGGLPRGRTTLVSGTAGSSKTVFACQFLAAGVGVGEHGVFVTFEETPEDIRRNMAAFGWDIARWEQEGRWRFVDASPQPEAPAELAGEFDLGAMMARIEHAVQTVGAERVAVDSLGAVFAQMPDTATIRHELFGMVTRLKGLGVTAVLTAERASDDGPLSRYDIEEFITDNVLVIRNALEGEKRRRTMEVLKFRGASHRKGEYPFSVLPGQGIVLIPLFQEEGLRGTSTSVRLSSGNDVLDDMCGGGFFRDSIVLASGATGTGKTLLTAHYAQAGAAADERVLLFAFEESREQLLRNAGGWGIGFRDLEERGLLRMVCEYPDAAGLEDHLIRMRDLIERYRPRRVAIDGLSALERLATPRAFREFVFGITAYIKQQEINALFTATTPTLIGGGSVTEAHISSITDTVILLRYVEMGGEMRRGLMVLKMRGSPHDRRIRDFTIDGSGLHIGAPFRNIAGILAGAPRHVAEDELTRLDELFSEGR
jgi:circadian clock protein KaiC